MGRYEWLNKLETKKYIMPFVIEKDNEYKKSLQAKFEFICNDIEISGAEKTFVNHVKNISGKIMNSFELYYKGELWAAHMNVDDIINSIPKDKPTFASINCGEMEQMYNCLEPDWASEWWIFQQKKCCIFHLI